MVLKEDRKGVIVSIEETGAATENRFLRIMSTPVHATPHWYLRTEKAEYEWDHRGIDFFVYIAHKEDGQPVKVPVQIKSSKDGAREFRRKHTPQQVSTILMFVIARRLDDATLRIMIYARLRRIHESGIRYDRYYERELAIAEKHWHVRK